MRLLSSTVDSVSELEVLLFLQRRPDGEWDPNAVADLLYLDRRLCQRLFKGLQVKGFLTYREVPYLLYRFAPPSDVVATLEKLSALYAERRLMVIAMIAGKRPSGLRLFSNAFRLRKSR